MISKPRILKPQKIEKTQGKYQEDKQTVIIFFPRSLINSGSAKRGTRSLGVQW